jgi:transcriptional regulator with XRE-family HTH domain
MKPWLATIRSFRHALGMSQTALAMKGGVSLPTIQTIERGVANPCLGTLDRVLGALGLRLEVVEVEPDWDLLVSLGLPLTTCLQGEDAAPTRDLLVHHLLLAMRYLDGRRDKEGFERHRHALAGIVFALERHYPTLYRKAIGKSPMVQKLLDEVPLERQIRLSRVALTRLQEYL